MSGIERLCLVSADAARLAPFYESAFGARILTGKPDSGAPTSLLLALGAQRVELLGLDVRGRVYPTDSDASDIAFQHFAIVVFDIAAAYRQLRTIPGWEPISRDGPQRLPARSGGVSAFKFRDPEGHPLELLEFPAENLPDRWRSAPASNNVLGIDHTAISIADTDRSIAFYESLGLRVTARSVNVGAEQDRLDGLDGVAVEVTAMSADNATPHVELLCYRGWHVHSIVGVSDIAATRIVFRSPGSRGEHLVDPDGHRLIVITDDT